MNGWDWAFWSSGGALALAGLLLTAWSLLHDRPRGRRRCPRCWYDMSAIPGLKCPECGRTARAEKRLFRTRRRWRWAATGSFLITLGLAGAAAPVIASGNWVGYTPIPLLNLVLSFWPDEARKHFDSALGAGTTRRFIAGSTPPPPRMTQWQRLLAAHHAARRLERDEGDITGPAVGFGAAYGGISRVESLVPSFGVEARPALPTLLAMLRDPGDDARERAANTLALLNPGAGDITGRVGRMLRSRDERARLGACLALEHMNGAPDAVIARVRRAALSDPSLRVRIGAVFALARIAPLTGPWTLELSPELRLLLFTAGAASDPSVMVVIGRLTQMGPGAEGTLAQLLSDARPGVRAAAARALGMPHLDCCGQVALLIAVLGDEMPDVRIEALRALKRCPDNSAPYSAQLARIMRSDADADVRSEAIAAVIIAGAGWDGLVDSLAGALSDSDERVRFAAVTWLANAGKPAAPARGALRRALADSSASIRATAADALKAIGPE